MIATVLKNVGVKRYERGTAENVVKTRGLNAVTLAIQSYRTCYGTVFVFLI